MAQLERRLALQPSKFNKKSNTQGGDKHCGAMYFKKFDLTFRMLQHKFSKVSVIYYYLFF